MLIDWMAFTPLQSLAGGVMLGLAAAAFALLNGRIAGIGGILGGLVRPRTGDVIWRMAFVAGLVLSPIAYSLITALPVVEFEAGYPTIIGAGVLVGLGARFANGCTSGHGVCGISRASARSLIATLSFMSAGFVTVFILRHVFGV